jgi:hypothetical protein
VGLSIDPRNTSCGLKVFKVMDDHDIYICIPGEYVLYLLDVDSSLNGSVCIIDGIKNGKIAFQIIGTSLVKLGIPSNFVDSCEYGHDPDDTMDTGSEDDAMEDLGDETIDIDFPKERPAEQVPRDNSEDILAEYLMLNGACEEALDVYLSKVAALESQPQSTHFALLPVLKRLRLCYTNAAQCAGYLGHTDRMIELLMKGAGKLPCDAVLMCKVGKALADAGHDDNAWSWFQRASQNDAFSPVPQYYMATILFSAENDGSKTQCLHHLVQCCTYCRQRDDNQSAAEAIAMFVAIADMLHKLQTADPRMCFRALLRAINIARICGALQDIPHLPVVPTSFSTGTGTSGSIAGNISQADAKAAICTFRLLEARRAASEAFFQLGARLESVARSKAVALPPATKTDTVASSSTGVRSASSSIFRSVASIRASDGWEEVARKDHKKVSSSKQNAAKSAVDLSSSCSATYAGYIQGASAAYSLCKKLSWGQHENCEEIAQNFALWVHRNS